MRTTEYRSIFLSDIPLIDVRAPVEFNLGSLPGSVNFPILNDEERAAVGTTYKQEGNEAAVALGHQLISGEVKESRIKGWSDFIARHPNTIIYCFRGGQRSQITQRWLKERGVDRPLIQGGYKAVRQFLMDESDRIALERKWAVVSGPTGSGKTLFLESFKNQKPVINLEELAKHRGSAFGAMFEPQPTQINFENLLSVQMLKVHAKASPEAMILIEDESRMIGQRHVPEKLFDQMRASKVIWIDDPVSIRVERILKEYVEIPLQQQDRELVFQRFFSAIQAIHKKLGGLRTSEILKDIEEAKAQYFRDGDLQANRIWIEKLLNYYYDPLYFKSLDRRQVQTRFRGRFEECQQFVASQLSN